MIMAVLPYTTPADRILRATALRARGAAPPRRTPARPPPRASPAPPPPGRQQLPELPPAAEESWSELMAPARLERLPLTDMAAGQYAGAQTEWMDRAGHPSAEVHPSEAQRRAIRRLVAERRILAIAAGTNRQRLEDSGVRVPAEAQLLADWRPPANPSPDPFWAEQGAANSRAWHIYQRLHALGRQHGVPLMSHLQAATVYAERGGTLQGYAGARGSLRGYMEGTRAHPTEGLGQSRRECRRDRYGACMPEGESAAADARRPGAGAPGSGRGGKRVDPTTRIGPGGEFGPELPRPRRRGGGVTRRVPPPPPGEWTPADPIVEPGPRTQPAPPAGWARRRGGGQEWSQSLRYEGAPSVGAGAASLATTAATHYAAPSASTMNLAGFWDSVSSIVQRGGDVLREGSVIPVITDVLPGDAGDWVRGTLTRNRESLAAAARLAELFGPQGRVTADRLRMLSEMGEGYAGPPGIDSFPEDSRDLYMDLLQQLQPVAGPATGATPFTLPYRPPAAPRAPEALRPPAEASAGWERYIPMIGAAAAVGGVLLLAARGRGS